jgi:predicted transcriptional regulator
MYSKTVKDLMVKIGDYPTVPQEATIFDAIMTLHQAQEKLPANAQPFRAVLILNEKNEVIGKIGHLGFLKALEPKYNTIFDMEKLSRASLSSNFLGSIMEHYQLWKTDSLDLCSVVQKIKVKDVMKPVEENIEEDTSIGEAIHKIIMWQCLSVLVRKGEKIVGILRLSDVYDDIENHIISYCKKQ